MRKQYTVFNSDGKVVRYINATTDELSFKVAEGETYQEGRISVVDVQAEIRQMRDNLLSASDWTQFADVPLTSEQKQNWINYRQQLRDLPGTYQDAQSLDEIQWPQAPGV